MTSRRSHPADGELDVGEHGRTAVALGEPVDGQHHVAGARWVRELHRDLLLTLRSGDAILLQLAHARVERLRRLGPLRTLAPHGVGEGAEPVDLGALACREPGEPFLVGGTRGDVLRVGAAVLGEDTVVEVQDPGDRRVE